MEITAEQTAENFAAFFEDEKLKPYILNLFESLMEGSIAVSAKGISSTHGNLISDVNTVGNKPFVLHHQLLYFQRYFAYETTILQTLQRLMVQDREDKKSREQFLLNHISFLRDLFPASPTINWQLVATLLAFRHNFQIIAGGPGTGKTTVLARVLSLLLLQNPNCNIKLAAPTGKAAARMVESIRNSVEKLPVNGEIKTLLSALEPSTIHRLLGAQQRSIYFKHNENNPLHADVVVVDEASMVDVSLFAKLMSALRPTCKLILLGDRAQLSSVEAGSIFGDICESVTHVNRYDADTTNFINQFINEEKAKLSIAKDAPEPLGNCITELKQSHRFSDTEGIGLLSKAVLQNDVNKIEEILQQNNAEQVEIDLNNSDKFLAQFANKYSTYIDEPDMAMAIEKFNQQRVLCAVRNGPEGIFYTNQQIEKLLGSKGRLNAADMFYHNRPVMLTKNYPDLGVFNGEVGLVRYDETQSLFAYFIAADGQIKKVAPGLITDAETAFAMTIHKSQGSEFDEVLLRLPRHTESKVLSRELLYTGITRAKKKIIVQSTKEAIFAAAKNKAKRASGIGERLKEGS